MYLISGRRRIDSAADGKTMTKMKAGDFGFIGNGVFHRVRILDDGRCDGVFVRLGERESVVAVDGPGLRLVA